MQTKKTLVIGASIKPSRYSNMAIRLLRQKGHPVVAIGLREGQVEDVPIFTHPPVVNDIHTVTIYINPVAQEDFYDYLLSLNLRRIIFNPGTENRTFKKMALEQDIEIVENCTLVMLNRNLF
ncbi:MAG: CoA-binding protein [Candidatus Zixiibacteriota bacterium]|nr:MAG: CoA-binding protein [candidate division Zixibacteria bacterium]